MCWRTAEFILPAIPMDVAWANGPFNADLRGWLPCRPGSDIHSGVLACPAFILHNRRGGYTVLPELDNFVKEWKDGKKSSLEHPFGLKVQPRGTCSCSLDSLTPTADETLRQDNTQRTSGSMIVILSSTSASPLGS